MAARSLPLAVAAVTVLVFSPGLDGAFLNWDDDRSLLTNEAFRGVGLTQLRWMFTTTLLGHYWPLTWLSFGVTHALAGLDPWAYRLGNVGLHAFNTGLVHLLACRLLAAARPGLAPSSRAGGAALAALAFGLHPLRGESVGWISGRGDLLCGAFYLLSVLAYLRAAEGAGSGARRWRAASLAAFAAALLSKEIAMTLPLSLALLDAYPLRRWRRGWRTVAADIVPYVGLAVGGAGLALFARSHGATLTSYTDHGPAARLALAAYSLAFYPLKLLWPAGLSPLYELPPRIEPLQWRFVAAAVAVVAVTGALIALRRRVPAALVAWLHFVVAVAPVSGLAHAGSQMVADRYSYLPTLGFALLAGGAGARALEAWRGGRLPTPIAVAGAGVALCAVTALATLSWEQSRRWRDSVSLWRAAVAVEPDCMLCRAKLGAALLSAQAPAEAEPQLRRAIELAPDRAGLRVDHGVALALSGRDAEAEREFVEAIRLAPGSVSARTNLGVLYTRQRRLDDAVAVLQAALALRPADPQLRVNLGQVLVEQGRPRDAAATLEPAVALAPERPDVRFWLGRAYLDAGDTARATPHIAVLERLDAARAAELGRRSGVQGGADARRP